MKLNDYMHSLVNQIDTSDDFTIRRAKEKAFAQYQVYRLQYHRPQLMLNIIQIQEKNNLEIPLDNQDAIDFELYVIDALNKAMLLSGEPLFQNMARAFLDYVVIDSFWELVRSKGYVWVKNHLEHAKEMVVKQLFKVDPNLKKMTLDDFINGYDATITDFEKNELVDYGDKEEQFTNEEMDAIFDRLLKSRGLSDKPQGDEDMVELEEEPLEWTLERQNEAIESRVQQNIDRITDAMNGYDIGGLFPYHFKPKKFSFIHMFDEDGDLNEAQVKTIVDRLQSTSFPGFQVHVVLEAIDEEHYQFTADWKHITSNAKN